ncbi:MAG: hypothetical protein QOC96_1600 [Acidobacteriota bacterium]|nr:hypothetical protein [Acidobacteriota bacterium]
MFERGHLKSRFVSVGRNKELRLKRHSVIILFCLLCSLAILAQSRGKKRHAPAIVAADPPIIDIRQIDFKNFAYTIDNKSYKLRDGYYAETIAPNMQWELGMVDGPFYGDLTGDRKDEVAFVLSHGAAQSPNAAEARVYTLQNGRPVLLATFALIDSVNCQIDHYIHIDDGMITVERIYGKDSRCDHNEVTDYRWNGNSFMPVGATRRMNCRCM